MAADPGFLAQLTGGEGDERAAAQDALRQQRGEGGAQLASASGAGASPLVGGIFGALGGLLKGEFKGVGKNFTEGVRQADDRLTGRMHGITGDEVASRRAVRQELSKEEFKDDGSFDARIKMARRAASIANQLGDVQGVSRALTAVDNLTKEKEEFNKLQAQTTSAEAKAVEDQIDTGFSTSGKAQSGIRGIHQGAAGLWVTENGKLTFKPFDESFSLADPADTFGSDRGSVGAQLKKINGVAKISKIKSLASSANTALEKTDRILSTLTDLTEKGGVESVIGVSGGVISSIDNLVRNVNGVINTFASRGAAADGSVSEKDGRSFEGRSGLRKFAEDAGNSFSKLIQLPAGVEETSAAAQQHRANVMEMAYMAARLAEPSNRGLSDNDIKNALTRIAGDTSNPQVMMRRFLEMQIDASHELDFELRLMHGSLGPNVSDDQINAALVGKGYPEYKSRKDEVFQKFGIRVDGSNRAVFAPGASLDADVQPGTGVGGGATTPESGAALLDDLFGPQEGE